MMHDYSWDVNNILFKANEKGLSNIEGFCMYMDDLLSNKPENFEQKLVDNMLSLLHELVEEDEPCDCSRW